MGYGNISFVMTTDGKAAIKLKFDGIRADMPFLVSLTPEERKNLRTIGPGRLGYVTEVNIASNTHSTALAGSFSLPEFNKDKVAYGDLAEFRSLAAQLLEGIDNTLMALGAELMKEADLAYGYLKLNAKKNNDENLNASVKRIASILKQAKKEDKK